VPRPEAAAGPADPIAPPAARPSIAESISESTIQAVSGGIDLIVGPFTRFQDLGAFVKALRALTGVEDVTMREFVRSVVRLRVRYAHTVALATRLQQLREFSPTILSATQTRVEVKVEPLDRSAPAR